MDTLHFPQADWFAPSLHFSVGSWHHTLVHLAGFLYYWDPSGKSLLFLQSPNLNKKLQRSVKSKTHIRVLKIWLNLGIFSVWVLS